MATTKQDIDNFVSRMDTELANIAGFHKDLKDNSGYKGEFRNMNDSLLTAKRLAEDVSRSCF